MWNEYVRSKERKEEYCKRGVSERREYVRKIYKKRKQRRMCKRRIKEKNK